MTAARGREFSSGDWRVCPHVSGCAAGCSLAGCLGRQAGRDRHFCGPELGGWSRWMEHPTAEIDAGKTSGVLEDRASHQESNTGGVGVAALFFTTQD